MVSNARDDLPDPLTPVTTVMALCGISTVTFFRLWTRAPWTRKASCSGLEISAEAVICLVAKGSPRQQVSKLLPKLQIIRRLSKASKCWIFVVISLKALHAPAHARLRFLGQNNLSNPSAYFQVNRHGRLSVSLVGVRATLLFQPMGADGTNAPRSLRNNADFFRQPDVGLSHAAFDVGGQIGLTVARQIHIHLPRAQMEIETSQRNISKIQVPLPRSHVHTQFQGQILVEPQIPFIPRIAKANRMRIL